MSLGWFPLLATAYNFESYNFIQGGSFFKLLANELCGSDPLI